MKTQESGNLRKGGTVLTEKLIDNDFVMFDLEADSAEEVIRKMADVMEQNDRLIDKEMYVADVLQREKVSGTAVGFSVATPHAKSEGVKYETLAFAHLKKPIAWDGRVVINLLSFFCVEHYIYDWRSITCSRKQTFGDFGITV